MIHDSLANAMRYSCLGPSFEKAFAWLAATDLPSLAEGRIDIEGDAVFALVQRYRTEPRAARSFETHRNYADIQVVVAGSEVIAYRQATGLEPVAAYDEGKEAALWRLEGGMDLVVAAGEFALFLPQDAHAPKIACREPTEVRKIVVKVRTGAA